MSTAVLSAQTPGTKPTFQLPPIQVTAQKEPANVDRVPVPVTPVTAQTIEDAGLAVVSEAGVYSPNTHFTDFSARKLSNARFRGIGASPANPAITTYFDGVPQLNANTSNIDLLDVDQIEFVRGPQSTLFGRNTLGGVINVTTRRPALAGDWTGNVLVPIANEDEVGVRGSASGPIVGEKLGAGFAFNYLTRDGYTRNFVTGNDLDSREGFSGKGQLLWKAAPSFNVHVILSGERDRDGDYALSDVGGLRANPYQAGRDFEGFTERDIFSTAILTRWEGSSVTLSTATGIVDWRTSDATDLDYLPVPLATRTNDEESLQFTQEVRVASSAKAPIKLGSKATLGWQAGMLFFAQNYDQDATNTYSPLLLSLQFGAPINFSVAEQSPLASLDDIGIGVYGHGTVTIGERLDLIAGVRADHEQKDALIQTFTTPTLSAPTSVDQDHGFSDVSPQFAVSYRVQPATSLFGTVSRGYKAGGFNAVVPPGTGNLYDEESAWNVEGGVKARFANGRVATAASVFRTDWQDMQLNLPNQFVPGQFFIDNAGAAVSTGAEVEATARALEGLDVFGSFGYTRARFDDDVVIGMVNVGGHEIPNTPDFTTTFGAQFSHLAGPSKMLRSSATFYVRGEAAVQGAYHYDEANTQGQDAYTVANFSAGVRLGVIAVDAWIKNAFGEEYIPVAFEYRAFAPSGFIGEMGRPRTFGVNLGVRF